MRRFLDPRSDLVFKRIFGEHPEILRSFLNALLPFTKEEENIVSLEYLPAEQVPQLPVLKNSIVDVRCRDGTGRQFIVEMQMDWTSAFLQRMLFNASKACVRQLVKGEEFHLLQPVYGLGILDDTSEVFDSEDHYHHYSLVNVEKPRLTIEGLHLIFIELPKFKAQAPVAAKRLRWAWLRFLKEAGDAGHPGHPRAEQLEAEVGLTPEIRQALDMAEEGAYTPAQLEWYDRFWDAVRTERTLLVGKFREGKNEGRVEGLAEGREKGRAEARAEALRLLIAHGIPEEEARRLLQINS